MGNETNNVNTMTDSLSLIIDYGNGEQEYIADIPYEPVGLGKYGNVGITDALNKALSMNPGMAYEFKKNGKYTRWGHQGGEIVSVNGVHAESPKQSWQVLVNQEPVTYLQLGRPDRRVSGLPEVKPGDVITLILVTKSQGDC